MTVMGLALKKEDIYSLEGRTNNRQFYTEQCGGDCNQETQKVQFNVERDCNSWNMNIGKCQKLLTYTDTVYPDKSFSPTCVVIKSII